MIRNRWLSFVSIALVLGACSTMYQPLKLDDKTGRYPTSVEVDAGGVLTFDTTVDPTRYKVVLLVAQSNQRPSVFSFTVRNALAQSGITRVYSPEEFLRLAADSGITVAGGAPAADLVQRFSRNVTPVLVVDYKYDFLGDARFHGHLTVGDPLAGKVLLKVDHPRVNWMDADAETLYPVLNQLVKWIQQSRKGQT